MFIPSGQRASYKAKASSCKVRSIAESRQVSPFVRSSGMRVGHLGQQRVDQVQEPRTSALDPGQRSVAARTILVLFQVLRSSSDAQEFSERPPMFHLPLMMVVGIIHSCDDGKSEACSCPIERKYLKPVQGTLPATQCVSECAALQSTATTMSCSGTIIKAVDTPAIPPECEMIFGRQFFHTELVPALLPGRAGITHCHTNSQTQHQES
jgi:hypothetical protein